MSIAKKIFYKGSALLPMAVLKKCSPATTLLPYHHVVSNEYLPHISNLYAYKNEVQFNRDLDVLLQHFEPITVDEMTAYTITHNRLPKGKFLLSFDDGFKEVYSTIAPILLKRGLPAIFFINPAFVNNQALFYRNKISLLIEELKFQGTDTAVINRYAALLKLHNPSVQQVISALKSIRSPEPLLEELALVTNFSFTEWLHKNKPYVSLEALHSLKKQGFTIGAHSWDHPYYSALKLQDQIQQTLRSCDYVQENELSDKRYFSFPHYDKGLPQQLMHLLKAETTALFGTQNQKTELYNQVFHRFNAERPDLDFEEQLKGLLLYMTLQKILGKHQVARL